MESGLKYPTFNIKVKREGQKALVFDEIRKKWLVLTPEEWVRQHLVNYLITTKNFPKSLLSLEKEIDLNGTKKRYDLVVYNSRLIPIVLVECKAPDILLTEEVAEQALRYNLKLGVNYLLITNGLREMIFRIADSKIKSVEELPDFSQLNGVV